MERILENFNIKSSYTEEEFCSNCNTRTVRKYFIKKDKTLSFEDDDNTGETIFLPVMCECRKKEESIYKQKLKESTVQEQDKWKTFAEFKVNSNADRQLKDLLYGFIKKLGNNNARQNGLIAIGASGVGKTFAFQCLATAIKQKGRNVKYINVNKIIDDVRNTFDLADRETEVVDKYKKVAFLFIDDFGSERKTEFAMNVIYKLIDYRYSNKLPTFFTSNYTLDQLEEGATIDQERIISRIKDMCVIIQFPNVSKRDSKAIKLGDS